MGSSRRDFLQTAATASAVFPATESKQSDREYWIRVLTRIADPVLSALGQRKLIAAMPVGA
ncbi:MAG: twin-arginine translocation signal domain-containing protein, partial [Acidobacteriaceae bacterium]|nr:twin-arginine translocation signal domain-containing protein [Acidobacteriaceae bacterium]